LTYLSIYLAGKLHVLDSKGEVWKSFLVLIPILAASLVAASRIMDARHHPFDVISGSLLGILVAWASYRQYFPAVTEPWHKGRAYPIRYWGREPVAPQGPGVVRTDDAAQLLHAAVNGQDEEEMRSNLRDKLSTARRSLGYSPEPGMSPPVDRHPTTATASSGNVFRDQIAKSQRERQGDHTSYWEHANRRREQDTWSDSSSDSEDDHRMEAYELRPADSFAQTGMDSDAAYLSAQARGQQGYSSLSNDFGEDTSYHPPTAPDRTHTEGDMGIRH
jgi:diacylglycerol diphosphate phosphatase / phosphatidate phosphatase